MLTAAELLPPGSELWFNTVKYTVLQLVIFGVGGLLWVVAYVAVLINVRKNKFVQIPAAAVVANISWEWLWGFFFMPDLGMAIVWGYRAWAILDVFIVIWLFRYGAKQLLTTTGKQYLPYAIVFGLASWFTSLWFFIAEGYDMSMGATSAYIINVMMSAVYIVLIVKHPEIRRFSFTVAWTKGLGTALISVFMFIAPMTRYGAPDVPADRTFLLVLCVITFILDVIFVAGFWMRIRSVEPATPAPIPATA
jgi:hypothetical protein